MPPPQKKKTDVTCVTRSLCLLTVFIQVPHTERIGTNFVQPSAEHHGSGPTDDRVIRQRTKRCTTTFPALYMAYDRYRHFL